MKIAHVVCVFPPYKGGIGKSAQDFSSMMVSRGHQVSIFTPAYDGYSQVDSTLVNIEIRRIKPILQFGNGAFIPSILFELKNFDLIYLHYPFFGGSEIIWLLKLFCKKPKLIIHYHMDVLGLSPFLKLLSLPSRMIEKYLFKKASRINVASLDYASNSNIGWFYRNQPDKFRETFFGVDITRFRPKENRHISPVKNILFVGGLDRAHYFKGLEVLIESLGSLRARLDWRLKVVGRGGLMKDYKEMCVREGIKERVEFLDSVSDNELPQIYRDSDFFILPSINKGEAFGIVLIEAMASGLPVIASNLPGVRSVYTDKEGLRVEPGNKADLTSKISCMLDNEDLMIRMGVDARKLAVSKYSYDKVSDRLNDIINEL